MYQSTEVQVTQVKKEQKGQRDKSTILGDFTIVFQVLLEQVDTKSEYRRPGQHS